MIFSSFLNKETPVKLAAFPKCYMDELCIHRTMSVFDWIALAEKELKPLGVTRESCVLNQGTYVDNEIHDLFLVERDIARAALRLQPGEVDDALLVPVNELGERVARRDPTLVPHWDDYRLLQQWARHL